MMTCREVYSFLDDFIDGRLSLPTRLTFGSHMLLCSACRSYLASYRTSLEVARASEQADARPDEIPEQLIRAILASRTATVGPHAPE